MKPAAPANLLLLCVDPQPVFLNLVVDAQVLPHGTVFYGLLRNLLHPFSSRTPTS